MKSQKHGEEETKIDKVIKKDKKNKVMKYIKKVLYRNAQLEHPLIIGVARGIIIVNFIFYFTNAYISIQEIYIGLLTGTMMISTWGNKKKGN